MDVQKFSFRNVAKIMKLILSFQTSPSIVHGINNVDE